MEEKKESFILGIFVGCGIGAVVALGIFCLVGQVEPTNKYITISQETADDLCIGLTGNESAIAIDGWHKSSEGIIEKGQITCEIPSYDSTHNIVIRNK